MLNTSDTVRSTNTPDGRVLLDVRQGRMFSVNRVGSTILTLIETGWDETRIAEEISRTYSVSIDIVRLDVRDFCETLRKHGILQADGSVASREAQSGAINQ